MVGVFKGGGEMNNPLRLLLLFVLGSFFMMSVCYAETVRIIAEDDWYPYSAKFDTGSRGIAVDIVRAAFKAEGVDVVFDVMNYDRGMEMVKDGNAVGCFDAPRTGEIENIYLWHDKALFSAAGFFYASSDFKGRINSMQDFDGKTVGLTQGYGYGNEIDMNTAMVKKYSHNDATLIRKLSAKRLDFIVLFDKIAEHLMPWENGVPRMVPVFKASSIDIYLAFSKSHPEGSKYRDIFSRGFVKIEADGTYQKIIDDWDIGLRSKSN